MTCNQLSNNRKDIVPPQALVLRFLGAGIVNTAFGYLLFSVLVLLGVYPQAALAIQFMVGVFWNYNVHARYVFGVRGYGRLRYYILAYVAAYIFNAGLLQTFLGIGLNPYLAQFLALGPTVVLSYVLVSYARGVTPRGRRRGQ